MTDPIDAAAEALYGVALSGFTAERKRLADDAKARGDKPAAAAIAKLPKPSVSAWVVNLLLREGALAELFAAAARVRAGELAAAAEQRAAIAQLRARAARILEGDAHTASPAVIQRITTTLQALAATGTFAPDAPGRLIADRDPPGFEAMAGVSVVAPPAREVAGPAPVVDRAPLERAAAAARQLASDRRADVMRLRAELTLAEAAAARLRERLAGVEAELVDAEARAATAQAALDETVR